MKRVIIVHGWEGKPDSNWFPWLQRELKKHNYISVVPQFPPDNVPKLSEWLDVLQQATKNDTKVILVGHSLGVIAILRYLENHFAAGAVLVSGFSRSVGFKEHADFFRTPVDWEAIRRNLGKAIVIHSDNDPLVPLVEGELIAEQLRAAIHIAHEAGHISKNNGNITEYLPILQAVLEVSK